MEGRCCDSFEPNRAMLTRFTSEMYRRHTEDPDQAEAEEAAADDDPDGDLMDLDQLEDQEAAVETERLENVDYEIISMLDATVFNENLLFVHLDGQFN